MKYIAQNVFEPGSSWSPSTKVIFPRFHLGRPVGALAKGVDHDDDDYDDGYDDDDDYGKYSSLHS